MTDEHVEHAIGFVNRRGQWLRASINLTASDAPLQRGVLLIHGLGGHRNERHIEAVARAIAVPGTVAVRIDLADNAGESDGSLRDMTISREVDDGEDALAAVESMLAAGATRSGVCGHSFGGMIAMLLAARCPERISVLATMSAVFDAPARFRAMRAEREAEFRERGALQLGDNPAMTLGPAFFDDLDRWDIAAEARKVAAHTLLLHGIDDDEVNPEEAQVYVRAVARLKPALRLIDDADHTYTDPRALDEVAKTVASWFAANLG